MTISSTTRKAGPFFGNGATTSFPFTFKVFKKQDLQVTLTDVVGDHPLVLDSDYSVLLNVNQDSNPGGTVLYPILGAPLASAERLTIFGALPNDQPTDIQNNGGFYPQVVEDMGDRSTIQIQQLAEETGRALKLSVSDIDGQGAYRAGGNTIQDLGAPQRTTDAARQQDVIEAISNLSTDGSGQFVVERLADAIAPGNGANMVAFRSRAPSAIPLTVQNVLDQWLTPQYFGAVGDGVADDTLPMQRFAAAQTHRQKRIPAGRYRVTAPITFQPGDDVEGDGPDTVIVAEPAGWTGAYVMGVSGALVALPALSSNVQRGSASFSVVSAPALAPGDVGIIYNPTNSSFSAWRTYYRAGEFFRVSSVDGSTVRAMGLTYAGYTAAQVNLYKVVGASTRFSSFRIEQPSTQNAGLRVSLIDTPIIQNITTNGSTYCGIELDRCFDVRVDSNVFQASPAVDDEYGLLISNCQGGTLTGAFYGGRHAIAFGGGSAIGSVPCRGISVFASNMGCNNPSAAQDLHGNTEDIRFFGGTFANGGVIGGLNHRFSNCRFLGNLNSGVALFAGEPVGGGASVFTGCHFESSRNPNAEAGAFGMLDLGNNSVNMSADTTYQFDGCTFRAPAGCTYLVKAAIDGTPGRVNLIFNAPRAVNAPDVTEFVRLSKSSGSGSFGVVRVREISGFITSGLKYVFLDGAVTADRFQLPRQNGIVNIPVATAAASGNQSVAMPNPYPRAPNVLITARAPTVDNKRVGYSVSGISATTFSATCYLTTDSATTTAASSGQAAWETILEE